LKNNGGADGGWGTDGVLKNNGGADGGWGTDGVLKNNGGADGGWFASVFDHTGQVNEVTMIKTKQIAML
jgi:hypothetical protein